MDYKLFDLHCDTPYRMCKENQPLRNNKLHIALDKTSYLSRYAQIAAVWSDCELSDDDAYLAFWRILNNFKREIESNRQRAAICRSYDDFAQLRDGVAAFFLAVEDARIIGSNVERIREIYDAGVRFISLNWSGENIIGGGYDTNSPLTHIGRSVVKSAFDLGMIIDVSHSSARVIDEISEMAAALKRPIIASHSDCNSIAVHPRNLTDSQFTKIRQSGGIVGISLANSHLCGKSATRAKIDNIVSHIEYFLGLDGQYTVCLGCDFDGIDSTPEDIESIADLYKLADAMSSKNFSDELINAIFYQNAYNFLKKI
ncbi:MAG: membrane dipeptidase [Clostridia bacterium]|nr:membrane dipeptidase [Clostridia bacterium]